MADRSVTFHETTLKDGTIRRKIVVDGYAYHKDKDSEANPKISFWECDMTRHHQCKARIHVQDDVILNEINKKKKNFLQEFLKIFNIKSSDSIKWSTLQNPNLWTIIYRFQDYQALVDLKVMALDRGEQPPTKNYKCFANNYYSAHYWAN